MDIWILLVILWTHFVADFMLQTDAMAKNKSTSNKWLGSHVVVYTSAFILLSISPLISIAYALVNGVLHFITDYVTSRITSRLWAEKRVHDFFVVIGLDQVLHATALILTYKYMML